MLNIENSLLLIIDVQERLVAALERDNIVDKGRILTKAANILNIPIILTEQYPKGLGYTVLQIAEPADKAEIIEKTSFSAVQEDGFLEKLKSFGKKQIVVGGIETHVCVHQTVSDLLDEGFEVYIVKDACASRKKNEFKQGIAIMQQNGAKITCSEIVLFEWLRSAKHPKFKEIQALIK